MQAYVEEWSDHSECKPALGVVRHSAFRPEFLKMQACILECKLAFLTMQACISGECKLAFEWSGVLWSGVVWPAWSGVVWAGWCGLVWCGSALFGSDLLI